MLLLVYNVRHVWQAYVAQSHARGTLRFHAYLGTYRSLI